MLFKDLYRLHLCCRSLDLSRVYIIYHSAILFYLITICCKAEVTLGTHAGCMQAACSLHTIVDALHAGVDALHFTASTPG